MELDSRRVGTDDAGDAVGVFAALVSGAVDEDNVGDTCRRRHDNVGNRVLVANGGRKALS